jgi:hypothetical protein
MKANDKLDKLDKLIDKVFFEDETNIIFVL